MALPKLHEVKDEPVLAAVALLWFATPLVWLVLFVLTLVGVAVPDFLLWLFGLPAALLIALLLWGAVSGPRKDEWQRLELAEGMTYTAEVTELARFEADHWGAHEPTGRSGPIRHLIIGEVDGRRFLHLERDTINYVLVEMDGWLPPLRVWLAVTIGARPVIDLESAEFNRRFAVEAWDRSPVAQRYAHQVINPVMMTWLMSREPDDFWIKGRWLVDTAVGLTAEDVLKSSQQKAQWLAELARHIPSASYRDWAHLEAQLAGVPALTTETSDQSDDSRSSDA